jgi:phosphoribosylaminoimidazolecarboxamide formyltransferase / IMP cyclohydrolase
MPRALLSVSDKTGVADLARGLADRGFEIVSTGGTARALTEAGLAVTAVSDVTGFPEMLDGRVKTLHPALHGGILARRDRPDDLAAIARHGVGLVDIVVVNLYPFAKAAADPDTPFDALVEEIDIGGPSLVRAAAKNFRGVLVVVDPADYPRLLASLDGGPDLAFRYELMRKALAHTAAYDTAISATLAEIDLEDGRFVRRGATGPFAVRLDLSLRKLRDLRYGENPHQRAAWYVGQQAAASGGTCGLGAPAILQGKELSFTNLLDLDAAARIVLEFDEPAAAVIKHTNPCGVATGESAAAAYVRAREADPVSAFGGIVALNRPLDVAAADAMVSTFIECVVAPSVEEGARVVLAKKPNMRVIAADFSALAAGGLDYRSILGAALAQERDRAVEARGRWSPESLPEGVRVVTKRAPTAAEWIALRFAWRVCAHVKSNTIIFTDAERTLAIGAGQMSRVDAANVAAMKAG